MNSDRGAKRIYNRRETQASAVLFLIICVSLRPGEALAYIDPGTSGMLSQVLYVTFYAVLAAFIYWLRYIKQFVVKVRQSLAKVFGGF